MNTRTFKVVVCTCTLFLTLQFACNSVPTNQLTPDGQPVSPADGSLPTGPIDGAAAPAPTFPGQPIPPGGDPPPAAYAPQRVIVQFRETAGDMTIAQCNTAAGGVRVVQTFSEFPNLMVVEVPAGTEVQSVSRYLNDANVLDAELDYEFYALLATPSDPLFPDLWGMHNDGQTVEGYPGTPGADVRAVGGWDITTGDPNFRIAVI